MFNQHRKKIILNPYFKKLIFSLGFFYTFTVLISGFCGYLLNQVSQTEEAKIKNEWYEKLDNPNSNNSLTEFEKKITTKLKTIAEILVDKNHHNQKSFETMIVDCTNKYTPTIKYPIKWKANKISDPIEYVNYKYVCKIPNYKSSPQLTAQVKEKDTQIIDNFVEIIQNEILVNIGLSEPVNSDNNLKQYSEQLIKYFTKDNNDQNIDYSKKFSSLRGMWVYLANNQGEMLYYPARETELSLENHVIERPWWKASIKNDNEPLNITPPYVDASDNLNTTNIIRTSWYKFSSNGIQYVLCVDLFFDSTQEPNGLNLLEQYIKPVSIVKSGNILPLFLIQSLVVSLLLLFAYELKFKDFLPKSVPSNAGGLVKLKLQQHSKYYASRNANSSLVLTVQGETKETNINANSREAGWIFSFPNLNINQKNNQSNIEQQEVVYTYVSTGTYNLDMTSKQPLYRCIEIWKVFLESKLGKSENLGFFVANWNTTNSIYIKDELELKSINWEKEYEDSLETVKNQLRDHLSISEEKEFIGILDYSSKNPTTPQYLEKIDFIQKIIDNSSYLKQRKILLPDFEIIPKIYELGIVQAICTRSFLQILIDKSKIEDFFKTRIQERYYVEHEEEEFKKFYESLDDNHKLFLSSTSSFKIMLYQKNRDNIVTPEDDFCIVIIDGKPSIVAYTLTDNKYPNAGGWISWRNVDIEYYTELYQCQISKGHRIETVDIYLKRHFP